MGRMSIIKIKPAIYVLSGCSWGWVNLKELAEVCEMTPKRVLKNFFGLSKDIDILAMIVYGNFVNVTIDGEILQDRKSLPFLVSALISDEWRPDNIKFHFRKVNKYAQNIFVPAGWAQDVLGAVERGFNGVMPVEHDHLRNNEDDCPKNALSCVFNGSQFVAAVGIYNDLPTEAEEAAEDKEEELLEIPENIREKVVEDNKKYEFILERFYGIIPDIQVPWELPFEQFQEWAKTISNMDMMVGLKRVDSLETVSQWILPSVRKGKKDGWLVCAVYHKLGEMSWAPWMGPESDKL